jgi:hypothetical protein
MTTYDTGSYYPTSYYTPSYDYYYPSTYYYGYGPVTHRTYVGVGPGYYSTTYGY